MATRSAVGIGHRRSFAASYVHCDGQPCYRGPVLWRLFRSHGVVETLNRVMAHTSWLALEYEQRTWEALQIGGETLRLSDGVGLRPHNNHPPTTPDEIGSDIEYLWLVGEDQRLRVYARDDVTWAVRHGPCDASRYHEVAAIDVSPSGLAGPEPAWGAIPTAGRTIDVEKVAAG